MSPLEISALPPDAGAALERLIDGNHRFAEGRPVAAGERPRFDEMVAEQRPSATILSCSDSRVPVELIFDQGPGELFVVRVAGNVAGPSQIGSIEFAAAALGVRLVVVLGHTGCGAVAATIDELQGRAQSLSAGLRSITSLVRPAVEPLLETELSGDSASLAAAAVRANVEAAADRLRRKSEMLAGLSAEGSLAIVGAEYALATGTVDFFGPPLTS